MVALNSNPADAAQMAERLRALMQQHKFYLQDGSYLQRTCSIGFSCYPLMDQLPQASSWEQVVNVADRALYTAKNSGRNAWVGILAQEQAKQVDLIAQIIATDDSLCDNADLVIQSSICTVVC